MKRTRKKKIKVCYVADREARYSRTRTIIYGLPYAGKYKCDLVVEGFYAQLLLPVVRMLTRKPISYDVYISTFDTIVHDCGQAQKQ